MPDLERRTTALLDDLVRRTAALVEKKETEARVEPIERRLEELEEGQPEETR